MAKWYEGVVGDPDSFQQKVILPNLVRLMDIKAGESVLDIACGTGLFAKVFHNAGAIVTGTDISPELIEIARKDAPETLTLKVAAAESQPFVKSASIHKATIILALQNIDKFGAVLKETARVLKKGGKVFIVMNHPAFRVIQGSSWGWEGTEVQYRRIDKYLTPFNVQIDMHPGIAPREVTTTFHRPLQAYIKALAAAGLPVTDFEEWISHKKSDSGPRAPAENVARNEIPMFLCLVATKL